MMKWLLFLFLSFDAYSAGGNFTGSFYQKANELNWFRNGSTLDLDFANNRYYLNGVIYNNFSAFITASGGTFNRPSTATYFNSAGLLATAAVNEPRFDYNPITHESRGLLIEEARTNFLAYSQEFDNSYWNKNSIAVTANNTIAPDGTNTADRLTVTAGSGFIARNVASYPAGTKVTRSFFVKAGTSSMLILEVITSGPAYSPTYFDLSTETITPGAGVTASLVNVGNGWFRATASKTFSGSSTTDYFSANYIDTYGSTTSNGKYLYLWGAQEEIGGFPTTYIPTTTASVTRSLGSFSIPTASWYNANNGTFAADTYGNMNSTQTYYGRIIGGDYPKAMLGFGNLSQGSSYNGSTAIEIGSPVTASLTRSVKLTHSWDQTSATNTMTIQGVSAGPSAYAGNWATTNIHPGGTIYNPLNSPLKRMTFFPVTLSKDSQIGFTK